MVFMCFIRYLIEALLFFSKRISLLLSWNKMISKTSYPLMYSQYLVHSTTGIQPPIDTILVSVELCLFSFCFGEPTIGNPLPVDRPPQLCPLVFGCTANDPLTHHFSMMNMLELRISDRFFVPLIYLIRWTNLTPSSFSGSLVARN